MIIDKLTSYKLKSWSLQEEENYRETIELEEL